jgi:hypothetical protein
MYTYQCFGRVFFLLLQDRLIKVTWITLNMEAKTYFETLVAYTNLHGVMSKKTVTFISWGIKTYNLAFSKLLRFTIT